MRIDSDMPPHRLAPWVLSVIAVVLLAAVVAMMVGERSLSATRGVIGKPGMFQHLEAIFSLDEIVSENVKDNLRARQVVLTDVVVRDVLGDLAFLIGQEGNTVPVVLFGELTGRQRPEAVTLHAGQHVRIYGILRKVMGPEHLRNLTLVDPAAAAKLEGHQIYISAMRVAPLPLRESPRLTPPYLITSVAEITEATGPQTLRGLDVALDKVRVLSALGDSTFLIGSEEASVAVSLFGELTERQDESVTVIREGDVLRIYGVIRLLHSVQEIEDMLMLTSGQAARLRSHTLYVSALRVVQLESGS